MLKYANFDIVFQEVPEEVTLAINISNCPNQCPGCHSKYLWENTGKQLDTNELYRLVEQYKTGITCVCFMGGDNEPESVAQLARQVKKDYGVKVAWYSGKNDLPQDVSTDHFDYIKLGGRRPCEGHHGMVPKEQESHRGRKKSGRVRLSEVFYALYL